MGLSNLLFGGRLVSRRIIGLIRPNSWMSPYEEIAMSVEINRKDRLLTVTWDRLPLNVLDIVLLRELGEILECCGQTLLLTSWSAGQRQASAGVDIKDHTKDKVPEMLDVVHGVIRRLLSLPQVTIAAVRGACLGGGCEVASVCDFIVASEESSFATRKFLSAAIRRWHWRALRH